MQDPLYIQVHVKMRYVIKELHCSYCFWLEQVKIMP